MIKNNLLAVFISLILISCSKTTIKEIILDNAANSNSLKYGMPRDEVYNILKLKFYEMRRPDYDQPVLSKNVIGKDSTFYSLILIHIHPSGFGSSNFYHNTSFRPLLFKEEKLIGMTWNDYDAFTNDTSLIDKKEDRKKNKKSRPDGKIELYSTGTGFLIHSIGYLVTNYHVIEDYQKIYVYISSIDKSFEARIKVKDEFNDLAIIQITDSLFKNYSLPPIPFSFDKEAKIGERVFTMGFPLADVLGNNTAKLSDGIINSNTGIGEDPRLYQISNPIQPGNSGGPLFDSDGNIIGVVVATLNSKFFLYTKQIVPQNVNFAIKINYFLNLAEMLIEKEEILSNKNILKGLPLEEQFSLIQPLIVQVQVYR